MSTDTTLQAPFNPLIRPYLRLYGVLILAATIVGRPLALLWLLGPGQWWSGHYFRELRCELTDIDRDESLRVLRGISTRLDEIAGLLRDRN